MPDIVGLKYQNLYFKTKLFKQKQKWHISMHSYPFLKGIISVKSVQE